MLDEDVIKSLEKMGLRRWTKYDKDRLYIKPDIFGLRIESQPDGTISSTLNGLDIDYDDALTIMDGKYFVDVKTEKIGIIIKNDFFTESIWRQIRSLISKAEKLVEEKEMSEMDASFKLDWNQFFEGMNRTFPERFRTETNLNSIQKAACIYHVEASEMKHYVIRTLDPRTGIVDYKKLKQQLRAAKRNGRL